MKTNFDFQFFNILIIFVTACFSISSGANAAPWTASASSGTIDSADLTIFQFVGGYLTFKGTSIGDILARFNITDPFDYGATHQKWTQLNVTYIDQGSTTRVRVYLKAMDNTTGVVSTIVTFDSNLFSQSSSVQLNYVGFAHSFDFGSNYYYIEAKIERSSTAYNPRLYGIMID